MEPSTVTVIRVTTPAAMAAALAIRAEVFIEEQGVTVEEEHDGLDDAPTSHHVLALADDDTPLGTARLLVDGPGRVHVGRVAVRAPGRGAGVGRAIMCAIEQLAVAECTDPATGQVRIDLSAQETALEFYRRLGYTIDPRRYLDARLWHQDAHKILPTRSA